VKVSAFQSISAARGGSSLNVGLIFMKTLLNVILLLSFAAGCRAADDYDRCIENLKAGTQPRIIEDAIHTLQSGGIAAFPALIAYRPFHMTVH
jgi:hypothetical protein